jgi:hypothetical protein
MDDREDSLIAEEYNRRIYQDVDGTQSQDTLSGGQSSDPYLGGTSSSI